MTSSNDKPLSRATAAMILAVLLAVVVLVTLGVLFLPPFSGGAYTR